MDSINERLVRVLSADADAENVIDASQGDWLFFPPRALPGSCFKGESRVQGRLAPEAVRSHRSSLDLQ